jgi:hypothetical protein
MGQNEKTNKQFDPKQILDANAGTLPLRGLRPAQSRPAGRLGTSLTIFPALA